MSLRLQCGRRHNLISDQAQPGVVALCESMNQTPTHPEFPLSAFVSEPTARSVSRVGEKPVTLEFQCSESDDSDQTLGFRSVKLRSSLLVLEVRDVSESALPN